MDEAKSAAVGIKEMGEKMRSDREIIANEYGVIFTSDGEYTIRWDDIESEEDLIKWMFHLSHKTWFTRDKLNRFLVLVAQEKGYDLS